MRLLNAITRQLEEFVAEEEIPPYAILSHTWGNASDEVKLQNLSDMDVKEKPGYRKIDYCCKQALEDGLQWVWVDTCCIDKSSTAELSEAINSMFRWYQGSKICYAYLADVHDETLENLSDYSNFSSSRWFTRGWTLQELIAPQNLIFFSCNWRPLGTKTGLSSLLSRISRIEERYLTSQDRFWYLRGYGPSTAQIMSWAAGRKTTRVEDKAYCLLGLFDVNMPLLYGEGRKAFFRLQEELLKNSNDETLFAWGIESPLGKLNVDEPWSVEVKDASLGATGMLARSPDDFLNSGDIYRGCFPFEDDISSYRPPPTIVNRGVRAEMLLLSTATNKILPNTLLNLLESDAMLGLAVDRLDKLEFALIPCSVQGDPNSYLGIPLVPLDAMDSFEAGFALYGRLKPMVLVPWREVQNVPKNRFNWRLIHVDGHWISDWCQPSSALG